MVTISNGLISGWFSDFLAFMGGCFGCCNKLAPVSAVDELSTGLIVQENTLKKSNTSDDFWSTTFDKSQRSVSSIITSNQTLNQCSDSGSVSSQSEFVNNGLLLWNQSRLQWLESGKPRIQTRRSWKFRLSWNVTYENLLTNKKPFSHPIPLSEMVDFLVDVWDHEGLYD